MPSINSMGNPISQELKAQQASNDEKALELLTMTSKMLQNKIAATAAKLENEAFADSKLPIIAIVSKTEKYMTKVESKAPAGSVDGAISDVLSGNFLGGLKDAVTGSLNVILGDTTAGESEKQDFHVVFANNSLVRIDYLMFKHNFSSKGVLKKVENAFCYYLQVGVLNLEKVNPQVLMYELSRAIKENEISQVEERLKQLGQFAKDLYAMLPSLEKSQAMGSLPGGEKGTEGGDNQE